MIPEYAIGIRAFRPLPASAFAQPRCLMHAIHGAKVGEWEYKMVDGRLIMITHWEYIYP